MALERSEAQEKLEAYFASQAGIDCKALGPDAPLFSSGTLDSLEAVNLIAFLDRELEATLDPLDVSFEELDTVNKILSLSGF